jgi:hypothetical protein
MNGSSAGRFDQIQSGFLRKVLLLKRKVERLTDGDAVKEAPPEGLGGLLFRGSEGDLPGGTGNDGPGPQGVDRSHFLFPVVDDYHNFLAKA